MARTKLQIETKVTNDFGFEVGQNTRFDTQVEDAFFEAVRQYANVPWEWSRVRQESVSLTSGVGTVTLDAKIGIVDEMNVKLRKGSERPRPMAVGWLNPVHFDRAYDDLTRTGRPRAVTSEEFSNSRVLRVWPIPDASDYSLVIAYHRNFEYTTSNTQLVDGDTLDAPDAFEDLITASMKVELAPIVYGAGDQRSIDLVLREQAKIGKLKKHLPVIDPQVFVEPPRNVRRFRQGL